MFYQKELRFLCDTLQKSRVNIRTVEPDEILTHISAIGREYLGKDTNEASLTSLGEIMPRTMYRLTDSLEFSYIYLSLPNRDSDSVILIGPYLSEEPTPERLFSLGERCGIPPKQQKSFREFYLSIPKIGESSHLFIMLTTFCEYIWNTPSFSIIDVNNNDQSPMSLISEPMNEDGFDELLVDMKTMEKRYAFENELMNAVSLGQIHKEGQLLSAFSTEMFEKRHSNPLRNAKNYGIIMNTLLRKAAERGGVHPFYLDKISSDFAAKIEMLPALSENAGLMIEMFRSYCRLVRKHAIMHFSPIVQKVILIIDYDLSADLSLKSLADSQKVSAGYLSAIFKRDTGKTLSEYIRDKRMEYAKHLLKTTELQIQTIALHCGIVDVPYFSKTFKKLIGKTPNKYREAARKPAGI